MLHLDHRKAEVNLLIDDVLGDRRADVENDARLRMANGKVGDRIGQQRVAERGGRSDVQLSGPRDAL